jgi:hypothetical protein
MPAQPLRVPAKGLSPVHFRLRTLDVTLAMLDRTALRSHMRISYMGANAEADCSVHD